LFQLAEYPPKDLGALLSMFPSGPTPVVRRRGKELLDAVREVLRAIPSPQTAVDASENPQTKIVQVTLPSQEIAAVVSGKLSPAAQERDIWAASKDGSKTWRETCTEYCTERSAVTMFTAKESSLFKSTSPSPTVRVIATTKCTLFGQRVSGRLQ
jgi:hypothetical protein